MCLFGSSSGMIFRQQQMGIKIWDAAVGWWWNQLECSAVDESFTQIPPCLDHTMVWPRLREVVHKVCADVSAAHVQKELIVNMSCKVKDGNFADWETAKVLRHSAAFPLCMWAGGLGGAPRWPPGSLAFDIELWPTAAWLWCGRQMATRDTSATGRSKG